MARAESILIAGAGIAGLGAAIALSAAGFPVTLIERDPPPPDGSADNAFAQWKRQGVPQIRHSHVFLARLSNLLRDQYPELLAALLAEGCRELTFEDGLPSPLVPAYRPAPEDRDFSILSSRRITLELVMRRHALGLGNVTLLSGHRVTGLVFATGKPLRMIGVTTASGGETATLHAEVIIDATGQTSRFPGWLRQAGARLHEETAPAGIIYFTRHYRLKPGAGEPPRGGAPGAGDLDYIKYGVFRADNGWFSITLAAPEIETALQRRLRAPQTFGRLCALLPGVQPWTDPQRSEPVSPVFCMGGLQSVWRHYVNGGMPAALGFFAMGDAVIRSNPLYGRGCSAGFLQAHLLAQTLAAQHDPLLRARQFDALQSRELRSFHDLMVREDANAIRRAADARDPSHRPTLMDRLARSFAADAIRPAARGDIDVLRALLRGIHMLENPRIALRNPAVLLPVFQAWLRGRARNAHLLPPALGPGREEMLALLGINGA